MPQTEYKGSKYIALLEELRNLGARGVLFRFSYELSKKLGFIERKHAAGKLSAVDVFKSLDLENPALADVRGAYESQRIDHAVAELVKHFKSRKSPNFFFDWQDRNRYQNILRERFGDQEAQLVDQADKICRHEFEIFGSTSVNFGDSVNWHLDPTINRDWSLIHWSRIDIRGADRVGDVKLTWEMNRHQFFFTLGRAYWFTGDQKYSQEFAGLMQSWIDANPPEIGVNWYSNLEIALRLISWIWAYHYFLDSPYFSDALHFEFLRSVLQSCQHITKDFKYSLHSMKNNHLIGDATALALAGIMFPEFKESKYWRNTYINILYRELDNQVYDDGTSFEQAVSYHRFVLYFYLLLFRIMRLNDYEIPSGFAQKLEKMTEFIMYLMKPDRTIPQIGDCDDANVVLLSNNYSHDFISALSTGAALFQRGDFKKIAEKLSEETFWLNGEEGIRVFDSLSEFAPSDLSRGFPDGGYYIMRTKWDDDAKYLLFKCGPHADHGHADALHIELSCGGKNCLRDCGTYTYNGSWKWRTFFRSSCAHNTVVVDGESQSIPHRVFRWLKVAKPETMSWITSRGFDYVDSEHDGYSRYKYPVIHKRAIFFVKPEYWIVVDRLIGHGEHSIELFFHTPSGEHELEASTKIFHARGTFAIVPVAPDDLDVKIYESNEEPIRGWFSPRYGVKMPSTTLVHSFTGELPKIMATVIIPETQNRNPSVQYTSISHINESLMIELKFDGFKDTLVFNWGQKSPAPKADLDTDAEVVYLRKCEASGKIDRLALVNGSYIILKEKPILKAESSVKSIYLIVSPEGKAEIEAEPKGIDVQFKL